MPLRRLLVPFSLAAALALPATAAAAVHPGQVVVAYKPGTTAHAATAASGRATRVLRVRDVPATLKRLRARSDVRYAVRDQVARTAAWVPNDTGRGTVPGGWQEIQWNFTGPASINAPVAWENMIALGRPGGRGATVAVLDTGVAYRPAHVPSSPDLRQTRFVAGYDFIGRDPIATDRNGHGTHVASTIAESTNNGRGLTGLAYGVRIMPVKVLDDRGEGAASDIADGIRWAARRGADVINLSLEFSVDVSAREIPQLLDAIQYAHRKGAVIVGASGNEAVRTVAYPARANYVISVGSTTEHGCLSDFSNQGRGLDIVAPGGGPDAYLPDPGCAPEGAAGRDIMQVTLIGKRRSRFGIPDGYQGTSMAVPHVSAAAALVIASGLLGPNPSPAQVERRLKLTARDLGVPGPDTRYGAGLLDAGAATSPAVPVT